MSDKEKVVLIQVILTYVKQIHDGGVVPGPHEILTRLENFEILANQMR